MKKLILLTLPLLLVACGNYGVKSVEPTNDTPVQPIIVPEENNAVVEKPQKEVLSKPEQKSPKDEPEPTTDEMTQEIDELIDELISGI